MYGWMDTNESLWYQGVVCMGGWTRMSPHSRYPQRTGFSMCITASFPTCIIVHSKHNSITYPDPRLQPHMMQSVAGFLFFVVVYIALACHLLHQYLGMPSPNTKPSTQT